MILLKILLFLLILLLVLAKFAPNKWEISSEIVIQKPIAEVYDYVRYLRNAENYNKWVMSDPDMEKSFRGNDGEMGFVYCWHSTKGQAGKGEQEITLLKKNEQLDCEIRFEKPFKSSATTSLLVNSNADGSTTVTWKFFGNNTYLMKVMHLLLNLKKRLEKDMAESLALLKKNLES